MKRTIPTSFRRAVATAMILTLATALATEGQLVMSEDKLRMGERIVFLGDSITEAGAAAGGYVALVREKLGASADLKVEIIGAGISGNRVPDLERRLEKDVLSRKPTRVVIYIGINDVWHSQQGKGTPPEAFEQGLLRIIKAIQGQGAKVVLCTASVIGEKHDGSNALDKMLDDYCQISRGVARQTGSQLIDLRQAFLDHLRKKNESNADKNVLTTDGVHLNASGNQFVADQMLIALTTSAPAKLLRHVVLFKFKSEATKEQIEAVVEAFQALPSKIDTIESFECGIDVSVENLADGFTHGFVVTFRDEQGRAAYLPHAAHDAFVKLALPRVDKVLVFDYWTR